MREHFRRAALAAEKTLLSTPLEMSFRSAPAVLRLVDAVFAAETARPGVVEDGSILTHRAKRREEAGRIEIWPPLKPDPTADRDPWAVPVDYAGTRDPPRRLPVVLPGQHRSRTDTQIS